MNTYFVDSPHATAYMGETAMNWPKPTNETHLKKWNDGTIFVMRGGPAEGILFRLWPHNYPDTEISGWDELTLKDGSVYRRPHEVDPYMVRPGKPNKGRTNVPHMRYEESVEALPELLAA